MRNANRPRAIINQSQPMTAPYVICFTNSAWPIMANVEKQ
jgi:hypothetical protein